MQCNGMESTGKRKKEEMEREKREREGGEVKVWQALQGVSVIIHV